MPVEDMQIDEEEDEIVDVETIDDEDDESRPITTISSCSGSDWTSNSESRQSQHLLLCWLQSLSGNGQILFISLKIKMEH